MKTINHTSPQLNELILDINGIWVSEKEERVSYPDCGNDALFLVEDNSFWFKHRNNIINSVLDRYPFKNNFADIGGGNGFQAMAISEKYNTAKLFLLEPGYQGCLNAKKRGLVNVFNIPFQKFDFCSNNVDGVGLFDVLEHIEDDVAFISEIKSRLPPNSIIYITVPAHNYLWSDVDFFAGHFRRYNFEMIKSLATNADVELVFSSFFFSYVPFITYFVKHIPYILRGRRSSESILNSEVENLAPSGFVLKIFDLFHKRELNLIERSLIKRGGSCIAVFKT